MHVYIYIYTVYPLYSHFVSCYSHKNHWTPPPSVPNITRQGAENHDLLVAQSLAASSRTASWRTLNALEIRMGKMRKIHGYRDMKIYRSNLILYDSAGRNDENPLNNRQDEIS